MPNKVEMVLCSEPFNQINLAVEDVHGLFAFKCGIKDSLFMMDNFSGKKTTNALVLRNRVKSNTLTNSLITNVNYAKERSSHVIK